MSQQTIMKSILKHIDGMTVDEALLEINNISKNCKRALLTFSVANTTRGKIE